MRRTASYLLWLLPLAAAAQETCVVIGFDGPTNQIIDRVPFTFPAPVSIPGEVRLGPNEYRTYPSDCDPTIAGSCPCGDVDLAFDQATGCHHGPTLIQQQSGSACSPSDNKRGAYFLIGAHAYDPEGPLYLSRVAGTLGDAEESIDVRAYDHDGGDLGVERFTCDNGEHACRNYPTPGGRPGFEIAVSGNRIAAVEIACGGSCAIDDIELCMQQAAALPSPALLVLALSVAAIGSLAVRFH